MNRPGILGLSAIMALGFALLPGSSVAQQKSLNEQLIGTWAIVSATQTTKDGVKSDRWGKNPAGRLIFEANGKYSFIIIRSDIPKFAINNQNQGTADETKAAYQGVSAHYGSYSVDEATKAITTKIEAASFPNLNGESQKRIIGSVTADELKYTNIASSIGTVDEVVWRRAK
jgi:hypothetical protein